MTTVGSIAANDNQSPERRCPDSASATPASERNSAATGLVSGVATASITASRGRPHARASSAATATARPSTNVVRELTRIAGQAQRRHDPAENRTPYLRPLQQGGHQHHTRQVAGGGRQPNPDQGHQRGRQDAVPQRVDTAIPAQVQQGGPVLVGEIGPSHLGGEIGAHGRGQQIGRSEHGADDDRQAVANPPPRGGRADRRSQRTQRRHRGQWTTFTAGSTTGPGYGARLEPSAGRA